MSVIDRVRDKAGHSQFVSGVAKVDELDRDEALAALAAFLRVAIEVAQQLDDYVVDPGALTLRRVVAGVETYLGEGVDRPRRTQALVAAAFDATHRDVRSRRLNDPSRDYPGDIQAFDDGQPILAVEVRAKNVRPTETLAFVSACHRAGIERAFMVVIWPQHQALHAGTLRQWSLDEHNVLLTIIENVEDLLLDAFGWADLPLPVSLRTFVVAALERLKEIEAEEQSLESWVGLLGELRSGDSRLGTKEATQSTLPESTD